MIRTIASVIRGEGLASAARRANERIAETVRASSSRARSLFVKSEGAAILNVAASGIASRLGGVPTQLLARLRMEEEQRSVAVLHPGTLSMSRPVRHSRHMPRDFESAIREALAITGARAIHLEGMDGVPFESVLRLVESGIRLVVSAHDFSLFCARPHLLELPVQTFCDYSHDLDRCHRCLRHTWDVAEHEQADRRALAKRILAAATGVVFPSRFLLEQHRVLFSLPDLAGEVIEPGIDAALIRLGTERPAIAYAGSAKRHKGAHLVPEMVRGDAEWHAFGGGDEDLLRAMRTANVAVHGYYGRGQLPSLLARDSVGLVVIPSIWPETFSLVLSEAWQAGAAVVAFDLGAVAERIREHGGGWLVPLERGAAGIAEIVEQWRRGSVWAPPTRWRERDSVAESAAATQMQPLEQIPSAADAARAMIERYRSWNLL